MIMCFWGAIRSEIRDPSP